MGTHLTGHFCDLLSHKVSEYVSQAWIACIGGGWGGGGGGKDLARVSLFSELDSVCHVVPSGAMKVNGGILVWLPSEGGPRCIYWQSIGPFWKR